MSTKGHRKYKNAPIHEAVCQFVFDGEPVVDPLLAGRLFELVGNLYSLKPRLINEQSVGFDKGIGVSLPTVKVQFLSSDEKRVLIVGPSSISVHDLKPYTGWEKFKPRIARALNCHEQAGGKRAIKQISLRYINRIVLPEGITEMKHYFRHAPERPDKSEIPERIRSLFMRFEFDYEESPGCRAVVSIANTTREEGEDGIPVLLDLDIIFTPVLEDGTARLIPAEDVVSVVEELREKEYWLFESLITDETRRLFE